MKHGISAGVLIFKDDRIPLVKHLDPRTGNKSVVYSLLILLVFGLALPLASADVVLQQVNESSGIALQGALDVELRDANVIMDFREDSDSTGLNGWFDIYSHQNEPVWVKVYLKAKGTECYHECTPKDVLQWETKIDLQTSGSIHVRPPRSSGEVEFFEEADLLTEELRTDEDVFVGSQAFQLMPGKVVRIIVSQVNIDLPFLYYLDSLSTFSKVGHEKITILGNVDVQFSKYYPMAKVSDQEWRWEFSNLNPRDEHLKDILVVTTPKQHPSQGKCILAEVYPGYTTCVMSESQSETTIKASSYEDSEEAEPNLRQTAQNYEPAAKDIKEQDGSLISQQEALPNSGRDPLVSPPQHWWENTSLWYWIMGVELIILLIIGVVFLVRIVKSDYG